uniref:Uncharacterized protein n=1 Tax=Oncorhynchus tshawytscha TaxID=74940 RepID=A0AAZ3R054_ONCTS
SGFALAFLRCSLDLNKVDRNQHRAGAGRRTEKVNTRGCFTIMNQVKDLLLNDHSSVLPDYGSWVYPDLYKEFNALKERLGELTTMFEGVESSVDDMRAGRSPSPPTAPPTHTRGREPEHHTDRNRRGNQYQTTGTQEPGGGPESQDTC